MSPHDIRSDVAAFTIIPRLTVVETSFWNWSSLFAQKLMRGIATRRGGARAKRGLQGMSDHLLKDIGLKPREIWLIRENFSSLF
jgi:uncharacterized protein YjiS (DUF1127 family)